MRGGVEFFITVLMMVVSFAIGWETSIIHNAVDPCEGGVDTTFSIVIDSDCCDSLLSLINLLEDDVDNILDAAGL